MKFGIGDFVCLATEQQEACQWNARMVPNHGTQAMKELRCGQITQTNVETCFGGCEQVFYNVQFRQGALRLPEDILVDAVPALEQFIAQLDKDLLAFEERHRPKQGS